MERQERSINKTEDDVRSAGQTFLGLRMDDLLMRVAELDDKEAKNKLIEEYYENQYGTHDKEMSGVRTRVNSAIRIIKAEKVVYALKLIDGSDSRVLPEAVEKARKTIRKIECGEIHMPSLE